MSYETMRRPGGYLGLLAFVLHILASGALLCLSGCGSKNKAADEPIQEPATAEQAARILDLSTVPLVDGAKPPWPRRVAGLSYAATSEVKNAFEFHRKTLTSQGWKELTGSSVTAQSASATFSKAGFTLSLSVYPNGQTGIVLISLQNHGNIKPGQLPVPPGTKPVYVGDMTAMYVTEAAVPATADACRKLLLAQGWVPFGGAGDSAYYKRNAIQVTATVSVAPAQGGKTMISYSRELLSADLPAPSDAEELRYIDPTLELSFETSATKEAVVAFYRKTLATTKWEPTLDHLVEIDGKDEMIFRNPAKDMLTLAFSSNRRGKIPVSLQFQSAAEIAELDRRIKEEAPARRVAAETERAKEQARETEASKPLPKVAVTLPAEAKGVEATKDEIKFTVANGKAKAMAEAFRKQFLEAGWKEDLATLDAMAGALSFTKDNQHLTISYTDTGVMPAEISLSTMGAELERH
jgi:hypothetical protein